MDARPATDNPLGLNLDFLYGRGFLWAEHENVSPWVTLEKLRMEIPDLKFPFDVRGGLSRFRDTRCLLRELDLRVSEVGFVETLQGLSGGLDGFSDLEVRFLDGVILIATRVRAFGADTFVTFRLGAMPGEPGSDVVRLLAHEFRAYGPLPCSARQLVHTLMKRAVTTDAIGGVGHGTSYAIELDGDSVMLRPLKLVLLHVFARHGWKLPNLSRVVMGDLLCRPGGAVLRARSVDENWTRDKSTGDGSRYLAGALAADEARSLFERGDVATYAGRNAEALRSYQSFQDRFGSHPGLVQRLLDVLLLEPNPGNVAEAQALCSDLEKRNQHSLVAAMGRARIADVSGRREESIACWTAVSELLAARGESLDRTLCDVVVARLLAPTDPDAAIARLTDALRSEPRNRGALQELRAVYERTGRDAELEDVLKRLTGVAPDTEARVETYVALARHLMIRQGQIDEARAFLERALRIAPDRFEILDALGETWVRSGDPARAVKTLGSAATAARQRGDYLTASRLLFRIGRLWEESLGNVEQALMQVRRALDLWEEGSISEPLGRAEQLRYAARLCEEDRQHSEAIAYWTEALAALQLAEARVEGAERVEVRRALAATHRDVAAAYRARGRHDVAANHERRLVEMDPTDVEALDALEAHYADQDADVLIRTLQESVQRIGPSAESLAIRTRLAERLAEVGRTDDAVDTLEAALDIAPGAERVRRLLAALLVQENAAPRLHELLTTLRARVQQRDVQWAIAVELGDLNLDVLGDLEAAAIAYADAAALLPTRREAYVRFRVTMEQLASQHGWNGPSPLGQTLAEDLARLWGQLAEREPSAAERTRLLAQLPEEVAGKLPGEVTREPDEKDPPSGDVGAMFEDSWSEADDAAGNHQFVREAETRLVTVKEDDPRDQTSVPWSPKAPRGFQQSEVETLEVTRASRETRESVLDEFAQRAFADESSAADYVAAPEPEPDGAVFMQVDSNPRLVGDAEQLQDPGAEPLAFAELDGDTTRRPEFSSLLHIERPPEEVAEFRERYDETTRRPPSLSELSNAEPGSPLARVLQRAGKTRRAPSLSAETAVSTQAVPADANAPSTADLEKAVSDARKAGDDAAVASTLVDLLETGELAPERRIDLAFEVGELLYYELEESDRALPWLLEVRQLDPGGYGARPGVLNAIEAIYEERGSVDGQVEILKARLDQAQSDDMRDTYRLLLAQLEWEDRADADAARAWLQPVLDRDDRHEGVRRLLAEIAEDQHDWPRAAEHLKVALSVSGDGLDSVELEKRLALIHLDRLAQPDQALRHFRNVQEAAPGDAAIMDGVRRCQSALGDWDGYTASLREELRLLLGTTLPVDDDDDWLDEIDPEVVPEPLRIPASHVLADIARVTQDELGRPDEARALWATVATLWPEHLEAIERRIDLDQKLEHHDSES